MAEFGVRRFLSLYMGPPGMLAVARSRHDHCAALWRLEDDNLTIERYWEFERLSGQKHHDDPLVTPEAAEAFIHGLLAEIGIDPGSVSHIWGTPGFPRTTALTPLRLPSNGVAIHSLSHLASALFSDLAKFRDECVFAMALDGGPDHVLDNEEPLHWYCGAVSIRGSVVVIPLESPGPLWTVSWNRFGLEPGSLMALASACRCAVPTDLDELERGTSYWANESFMNALTTIERVVVEVEHALATKEGRSTARYDDHFTKAENVTSAVMKVVHSLSCRIAAKNIERLSDASGAKPGGAFLSMAGGFALNCPTNTYLMNRFRFRSFLTPPCVDDGGQALGLGLLGLYEVGVLDECRFSFGTPYLGSDLEDAWSALGSSGAELSEFDPAVFVDDLMAGPIAWADGAAEVGPRALGHRSILADPRSSAARDLLNQIKGRQTWRPVAPIVLEEHVHRWFVNGRRSPYMLEVFDVEPARSEQVPAIVHLDGTARIQTLRPSDDRRLHDAISAFHRATGVPLVCNTSLNEKGEPIANSIDDIVNFCLRKSIPVAYIGGVRVQLSSAVEVPATLPPRRWADFEQQTDAIADAWRTWLDAGRTVESLYLIAHSTRFRDLERAEDGVRRVELATRIALKRNPSLADGIRRWAQLFGPEAPPDRSSTARWHRSVVTQFGPLPEQTTSDIPWPDLSNR
jgi:carbamoyltransferase